VNREANKRATDIKNQTGAADHQRKGGRPAFTRGSLDLINRNESRNSDVTDEEIAAAITSVSDGASRKANRSPADVKIVKNVRYDRTKRSRAQDHE